MPVISFGLELSCELQEPKESLSVRKPPPVLYLEGFMAFFSALLTWPA